jgi:putative ABC transport system substrate-binding protein
MKHLKKLSTLALASISILSASAYASAPAVTVGIIAPIELPAMTEITAGFTSTLNKLYPGKIHYIIENAQGDINIQRSILQQFKAEHVNIVVPIGTSATQMAISMMKDQPVVALAAEIKDEDRAKMHNQNMTNILDEIVIQKQIAFIHDALPSLNHMTIIYSPDDRIYSEIQQASAAAAVYKITLQKMMMQQLPDLYAISKHIDNNSQAIFILKDEMIVSGISTLLQQAKNKGIPVIASDDGSVQKGAAFAVGVSERQIGIGGAALAVQVLEGKPAKDIPVKLMDQYSVFVNKQAMKQQHVSFAAVKKAAEKFNYIIVTLK